MRRARALGMIYPRKANFFPKFADDFLLFTNCPRGSDQRYFWIRNYQTSDLLYEFSELFMPAAERRNECFRYDVRFNLISDEYNSV